MSTISATTPALDAAMSPPLGLAVYSMWLRELVRFWRQKSRLFGAVATPLVFWLVLGAGFGRSVRFGEDDSGGYLAYFLPGIIVLTVLFTAIYSTISVIEDRQQGFLQAVLVAPVSRRSIVLGKMLGATTLALAQGALMLLLLPVTGQVLGVATFLGGLLQLGLIAFALSGLGLTIAWLMDSTSGFHAIMNLLLMPMWLLSGAVFPIAGAHTIVRAVMWINPLTYGQIAFRRALMSQAPTPSTAWLPTWVCVVIIVLFGVVTMLISTRLATRNAETTS